MKEYQLLNYLQDLNKEVTSTLTTKQKWPCIHRQIKDQTNIQLYFAVTKQKGLL